MSMKDKTLLARRIAMGLIIAANSCMAGVAMAVPADTELPKGESIQSGGITINKDTNSGNMTIEQNSDKGIIEWNSFNIGKDATVHFEHPNGSAMTLNRVTGGSMSEIYGNITADGCVILVNPNGAYFDKNSRVNTAGFIVSTANMSDEDFKNGNYVWEQSPEKNSNITVDGHIWIRPKDAGTSISYAYNKIMLIADGDVTVGPNANLMATRTQYITSTENLGDGFTGEVSQTASEGTIILRADQNADDVNGDGNAAKVYLNNTDATKVQAVNVSIFYNSDIIGNINGTPVSSIGVNNGNDSATFTQKNYTKIGSEVDAYKEKISAKNVTIASLVNNVYQLQAIDSTIAGNAYGNLSGSYALGTNIDASDTANWNNVGFNPIGVSTNKPFEGSFTGNGGSNSYSISNLNINRSNEDYVGLFASTNNATISSVSLIDPKIAGNDSVGGIAGYATNSFFDGNTVTSTKDLIFTDSVPDKTNANVRGKHYVGGLIGYTDATALRNCTNGAYVYGNDYVGGLAGYVMSNGTITTAAGKTYVVSYDGKNYGLVAGNYEVGGLIGRMRDGTIAGNKGSFNNGQVIGVGDGSNSIGGLAGCIWDSTISNSYNTNEGSKISSIVQSTDYFDSGNVMGSGSSPHGMVTGGGLVGGIVGSMMDSTLDTVYNAGNIEGNGSVGGIAGTMKNSTIQNAYNADNNTVYWSAQNDGEYYSFISNGVKYTFDKDSQTWTSYTLAADDAGYTTYKSGISTDELPSEESRLYLNRLAYRDATVTGKASVGGIVGTIYDNDSTLTNTYNAGRVTGTTNVGSLVGSLADVNSLTMEDGNSATGNFVVTTQSVTDKNIVKGNYTDMKVVGGSVDSSGNPTNIADNYNSGGYEKTFFQASHPSANVTNGVAWTDGKNQNDTWVIYNNSTTPLLKHYMTGITTGSRQYAYDGQTHSITTNNVDNYYGGAFFTNVNTDGVDVITNDEYTVDNKWTMMTNNDGVEAKASDDRSNSSFYKYDAANMWSPQHGYYTNGYGGVIITPAELYYQADSVTYTQGDKNLVFTGKVVNGAGIDVTHYLTGTDRSGLYFTTTAGPGMNVGQYPIYGYGVQGTSNYRMAGLPQMPGNEFALTIKPVPPDDKDHNITPMPDRSYFPNASILEDTKGRRSTPAKYGFGYGLEGQRVFRHHLTLQDSGIQLAVSQMDNSIIVDRSSRSDGGDTITIKRKAVVVNS